MSSRSSSYSKSAPPPSACADSTRFFRRPSARTSRARARTNSRAATATPARNSTSKNDSPTRRPADERTRTHARRGRGELALFPPVSGGSDEHAEADECAAHAEADERAAHVGEDTTAHTGDGAAAGDDAQDFFELTTEPIDVGSVARRVVPRRCGATVTLDGYTREWTRGRRTLHLVYEAYAPMALAEMRRLGREAHRRFDISHIGIVHRTGRTDIGETSVVISVSAPHRRAAFEACEWAIRELKRTVPIWKKEFFEDGSIWVEGEG